MAVPYHSSSFVFVFTLICALGVSLGFNSTSDLDDSLVYLWPLPSEFTFGEDVLAVDPDLSLAVGGDGGNSDIVREAFLRYRGIIFKHSTRFSKFRGRSMYDISKIRIIVHSDSEVLQLGVDESYSLLVAKNDDHSIIGEATIEANTVYGALRGLETFSQLCAFDYGTKTVQVYNAPWYIQDKPRFVYRGLMLDTSRHYLPIDVIKHVIESMSYAKLNVLHWHIIDEQSFPLEVPTYPKLWKGAYTKWERYTVEDAYDIVKTGKVKKNAFSRQFCFLVHISLVCLDLKLRQNESCSPSFMAGINVMAEIDIPGHAESWGTGYPDLWPSPSCREPLDVSKEFTFDMVSGILTAYGASSAIVSKDHPLAYVLASYCKDMRKIFPFELFHLGGDEVNTDCWNSTPHVQQWLQDHNMTPKEAYQYFVLRAQEIAISKIGPLSTETSNISEFCHLREETFNTFATNLNPRTVIHNWLGPGVCPKAVAKGFRCIYSNQGVWYLDHLDVPWDGFYNAEPLEGINSASEQELVLGGEVCMWSEVADTSNVLQTIWPRAAAAAGMQ
ncbi:Beta-hexosaminidase 1 [Vitis vinifera]|uniref:Beta-hexosaminidase n=1 Tax=Vitis vinifera TaxID=29760 RepID=A0A438JXP1_VITVI|nr:Beta-hexosaminidase 1 [Vitis vinifera]